MNYLRNLWLWLSGFWKLGTLTYQPGWNRWNMLPLYLVDYGFNTLVLAGQVVSVSRYCYIRRSSQPWKWLGNLLDRIQPRHIETAGDPLWGSQENRPWVRIVVPTLWLAGAVMLRMGHAK